jgi:hypothetical protein
MCGHPLLVADDDVGHLSPVFTGRNDRHETALLLGDGDVTRRPGDDGIDAVLLALAGLHVLHVRAVAAHVLLRGLHVVRGVDPVHRVGVVGLLVGVVGDLVVAHPLERDVPVAVAENSGDDTALRALRIVAPRLRAHQLVLAARVARGADDDRHVVGTELAQPIVDALQELRRAVAHDGDEVRAVLRVALALLHAFREGDELVLHLIGVVLAHEHEVHAVLAHEAVLLCLLATGREHHSHLGIPRPVIEAHLRFVGAASCTLGHERKRSAGAFSVPFTGQRGDTRNVAVLSVRSARGHLPQ